MKRAISLLLLLCAGNFCLAQNTWTARIKDHNTKEPLAGATVLLKGSGRGIKADSNGLLSFSNIPDGKQTFSIHFVGYNDHVQTLDFPRKQDTMTIFLFPSEEEMGEVVISSTRSNRSIQNIPTRVEFINREELEEKANMKPGDIRMMLSESTGIQTQQVSATSANSSIRIQGLDGRYTQILKDGFPLFGGFSGGLGLLQTPPLDLKQVEVIKGSSSTLYGGGAIAGLVNLISKSPGAERDLRFLLNGTSAGGFDVNGFYSQRWGKLGMTLYAGSSRNAPYDPSRTGFTAIPKFDRYVLNPKLFVYFSPATKLSLGLNTGFEKRIGGDVQYIRHPGADTAHRYYERNNSQRYSTQFNIEHQFNENSRLTVKNAISYFGRIITIPDYVFDGKQWSSFSEISFDTRRKQTEWIGGLNAYTDDFKEYPKTGFPARSYDQRTYGAFIQNTWKVSNWLQTETGLRGDYVMDYGFALLPRFSALFKLAPALTSRVGGGLGYKTPTIFTEETERLQFQSVLPVSADSNRLERSVAFNMDINYRTRIADGKISFTLNQLFFFTRITQPLMMDTLAGNIYQLKNSSGYLNSRGFETNIKLGYADFKLYLGYTFTDAHLNEKGLIRENPLTPRHRLNNVLVYEKEGKWKLGLEAYYNSSQPLNDGKTGRAYWTFGFMAEKIWKHFSLFINFENFTDARQTRFDSIYTGSATHPVFRDIYAPLDGSVVNGGLKVRL
jgi:iron complex outermembrane receptor protein